MKRVVIEMWVSDEFAAAGASAVVHPDRKLEDMIDEDILGVRVALPNGDVLRAGVTFG